MTGPHESAGRALDATLADLDDRITTLAGSGLDTKNALAALDARVAALEAGGPGEPEPPPAGWQPPLTITRGGVYEGRWSGDDPGTPTITVLTDEDVTIRGAVRGRGHLVALPWGPYRQRVTIERAHLQSLGSGRAVHAESIGMLRVLDSGLQDTNGIYVNASPSATIVVHSVEAIDIGRYRAGGDYVQFVQLNNSRDVRGGVRGCWVENQPFESNVEDIISLHASGGTPDQPFVIEGNLLDGAFARDPVAHTYSGGGIMLGDAGGSHAVARGNTVLNTSNYGTAISGGVRNRLDDNLVLGLHTLPDGRVIRAANVGAYVWHQGTALSEGNAGRGNRVGWVRADGKRNDWWTPDASSWSAVSVTPTPEAIQAARDAWHAAR